MTDTYDPWFDTLADALHALTGRTVAWEFPGFLALYLPNGRRLQFSPEADEAPWGAILVDRAGDPIGSGILTTALSSCRDAAVVARAFYVAARTLHRRPLRPAMMRRRK